MPAPTEISVEQIENDRRIARENTMAKAMHHRQSKREFRQLYGNNKAKSYDAIEASESCLIAPSTEPKRAYRIAKWLCRMFYYAHKITSPVNEWNHKLKAKMIEKINMVNGGDEANFIEMLRSLRDESQSIWNKTEGYRRLGPEEKVSISVAPEQIIEDQAATLVRMIMDQELIHSIHTCGNLDSQYFAMQIITLPIVLQEPHENTIIETPALSWKVHMQGRCRVEDSSSVKRCGSFEIAEKEKDKWRWMGGVRRRPHPHIEESVLCHGNGAVPAARAINRGELATYLQIVTAVLGNYNAGSPYVALREFVKPDLVDCSICQHERRREQCYTLMIPGNITSGGKTANVCGSCAVTIVDKPSGKKMIARIADTIQGLHTEEAVLQAQAENITWYGRGSRFHIPDRIIQRCELFELYSKQFDMTMGFYYIRNPDHVSITRNTSVKMGLLTVNGQKLANMIDIQSCVEKLTDFGRRNIPEVIEGQFRKWIAEYVKIAAPAYGQWVRDEESQARFQSRK